MKTSIIESLFFSIIINVFVLYRINFNFLSFKGITTLLFLIIFGAIIHYLLWTKVFTKFIRYLKERKKR